MKESRIQVEKQPYEDQNKPRKQRRLTRGGILRAGKLARKDDSSNTKSHRENRHLWMLMSRKGYTHGLDIRPRRALLKG